MKVSKIIVVVVLVSLYFLKGYIVKELKSEPSTSVYEDVISDPDF
jgi:hypothetical protein